MLLLGAPLLPWLTKGAPPHSDFRNASTASRSDFDSAANRACDLSASPPCHRIAAVIRAWASHKSMRHKDESDKGHRKSSA